MAPFRFTIAPMPLPTEAEIMTGRQTKGQLEAWGVPWPPPKGWRRLLLGISRAHYAATLFDARPTDARPRADGPEGPISPAMLAAMDAEHQQYNDFPE